MFAQEGTFRTGAAPLPRQAVLGWSTTLGADVQIGAMQVPALRIHVDFEGEGPLVEHELSEDGTVTVSRSPVLGRLSLHSARTGTGDVLASGAVVTTGRRAYAVEVANALRVVIGQTRSAPVDLTGVPGRDRPFISPTWGVGLNVGGALRTAGIVTGDASVQRLGEQLRLRVDYAHDDFGGGYFIQSTNAVSLTAGWAL